jgi:RNA polymerase sigma factor (sigma-70 family)
MSTVGSITHWIHQLTDENVRSRAQQVISQRFFDRVVRFLRQRCGEFRGKADADDATNSAFRRVFAYIGENEDDLGERFPDRDSLVRLLLCIALQRARNQIRDEQACRRGGSEAGHRVVREVDQPEPEAVAAAPDQDSPGLNWIADSAPSPELAVQLADECVYLLGKCNGRQQQVLRCLLDGLTQNEIARQLDCSLATVERTVRRIKEQFHQEVEP